MELGLVLLIGAVLVFLFRFFRGLHDKNGPPVSEPEPEPEPEPDPEPPGQYFRVLNDDPNLQAPVRNQADWRPPPYYVIPRPNSDNRYFPAPQTWSQLVIRGENNNTVPFVNYRNGAYVFETYGVDGEYGFRSHPFHAPAGRYVVVVSGYFTFEHDVNPQDYSLQARIVVSSRPETHPDPYLLHPQEVNVNGRANDIVWVVDLASPEWLQIDGLWSSAWGGDRGQVVIESIRFETVPPNYGDDNPENIHRLPHDT